MRLGDFKRLLSVLLVFVILVAVAFIAYEFFIKKDTKTPEMVGDVFPEPVIDTSTIKLQDNVAIYNNDDDASVIDVYATILPPDKKKYSTYNDFLSYRFEYNQAVEKPVLRAFVSIGKKDSSLENDNAIITPRGRSSSRSPLKSYKIKLNDNVADWGAQKILNLNYHPYDRTRVRNKLSFDLYETIPNVTSCRTQFVRLHLKDLSNPNVNPKFAKFKDMGIFTHVEQMNKRYLSSHGLDKEGVLYKVNQFEFYRYPEVIKLASDETYDKEAFELRLKIRGSNDHTKLINMLNDLNDASVDIDYVIDKYFDRENYLTWLASNVIIGNSDTVSQNFFLYSPQYTEKFYFLPWDCDGAWGYVFGKMTDDELENYENVKNAEWQFGIQNLWTTKLNNRFLRNKRNVKALDNKIDEMMAYYSPEKVREQLKKYYPIVSKELSNAKVLEGLRISTSDFQRMYNKLPEMPQKYYDIYQKSKQKPMPFYQDYPVKENGKVLFRWQPSFDLQGDELTYDLYISTTPDMRNLVVDAKNLHDVEYVTELPDGVYYMKAVVTDSNGNSMNSFDLFRDKDGIKHYGVRQVEVK